MFEYADGQRHLSVYMTNGRTDGEMDEILFMRVANSVKRNRNKTKAHCYGTRYITL